MSYDMKEDRGSAGVWVSAAACASSRSSSQCTCGTIGEWMLPPCRALKRFERRKTPPSFQFTNRDLSLLAHIARHRLVSSELLAALDGGSEQNVLRSLRV